LWGLFFFFFFFFDYNLVYIFCFWFLFGYVIQLFPRPLPLPTPSYDTSKRGVLSICRKLIFRPKSGLLLNPLFHSPIHHIYMLADVVCRQFAGKSFFSSSRLLCCFLEEHKNAFISIMPLQWQELWRARQRE